MVIFGLPVAVVTASTSAAAATTSTAAATTTASVVITAILAYANVGNLALKTIKILISFE